MACPYNQNDRRWPFPLPMTNHPCQKSGAQIVKGKGERGRIKAEARVIEGKS